MIFSFYFQYAGSKSLPLNYTSMAENFYSQSLSSLSSWGRGLNPDEVIYISMNFWSVTSKLLFCSQDPTTNSETMRPEFSLDFQAKKLFPIEKIIIDNIQTYSELLKKFGFIISELVVDSMSKIYKI